MPNRGFQSVHLELSWLVATGRVLDEMLLNWRRRAEKMGIAIVDAPYYQSHPGQDEWPLQSLLYIPLAVPPPSTAGLVTADGNDVPPQLFFEEIVRAHDFVLDFGTWWGALAMASSGTMERAASQRIERARATSTALRRGHGEPPDAVADCGAVQARAVHSSQRACHRPGGQRGRAVRVPL